MLPISGRYVLLAATSLLCGRWTVGPDLPIIELETLTKELRQTRATLEFQDPADQCGCEAKLREQVEHSVLLRVCFKGSIFIELIVLVVCVVAWRCTPTPARLVAPREVAELPKRVRPVPEEQAISSDSESETTRTYCSSETSLPARGHSRGRGGRGGPTRPSDLSRG
jgi:hypothetical protein